MMNKRINTMYFSATDTTKEVVYGIAEKLSEDFRIKEKINSIDFTLPKVREKVVTFSKEDIVVVGVPVYAGRVPNVLLKYLKTIIGNDALAIAVVVYGNRNYDDALIELKDILELDGFKIVAGAAFIGEHSFSNTLAQNRPDDKDMDVVKLFGEKIYKKIINNKLIKTVSVKGNTPYRKYYMPKYENGEPIDIRKVKPKTNNNCINCKICVKLCPMGSIEFEDVTKLNGICIKCGACIKKCPVGAKYFDDIGYLKHKEELENNFKYRREPELFI
ncbi:MULTISPECIES: EFR1 family ferrodoxin [Clostridium]|uniref:4Fe-4S dicluster domain-containing protein n=2 Tax=Clostridium TaxID=1485 RepID=A0AAU8YTF2_CLOBO|nr:EFR1 family ferrodoxin [Clostridium sporogenes]AVP63783.1 4Fe-4S dicluster domain-containing protein [Clostridium botulinum]MBY7013543.1 4Fe-4S binding protein [Clostridium sporogenes]MBY7065301.1 4Fe-4S binding protein [Clostridium sporogenes]MBY7070583.1 4Fe-4S binding protein [Clostridium sporogenes]MCF4017332.1 EFR1 family ferrodoxin [Clostridium sporogenes]